MGFPVVGEFWPSELKMTAPRYQEVKAPDIPGGQGRRNGTHVRVVLRKFLGEGAGRWDGICG